MPPSAPYGAGNAKREEVSRRNRLPLPSRRACAGLTLLHHGRRSSAAQDVIRGFAPQAMEFLRIEPEREANALFVFLKHVVAAQQFLHQRRQLANSLDAAFLAGGSRWRNRTFGLERFLRSGAKTRNLRGRLRAPVGEQTVQDTSEIARLHVFC